MASKIKLLDHLRHTVQLKLMSIRTEDACVPWIRHFMLFHLQRHPADLAIVKLPSILGKEHESE